MEGLGTASARTALAATCRRHAARGCVGAAACGAALLVQGCWGLMVAGRGTNAPDGVTGTAAACLLCRREARGPAVRREKAGMAAAGSWIGELCAPLFLYCV